MPALVQSRRFCLPGYLTTGAGQQGSRRCAGDVEVSAQHELQRCATEILAGASAGRVDRAFGMPCACAPDFEFQSYAIIASYRMATGRGRAPCLPQSLLTAGPRHAHHRLADSLSRILHCLLEAAVSRRLYKFEFLPRKTRVGDAYDDVIPLMMSARRVA